MWRPPHFSFLLFCWAFYSISTAWASPGTKNAIHQVTPSAKGCEGKLSGLEFWEHRVSSEKPGWLVSQQPLFALSPPSHDWGNSPLRPSLIHFGSSKLRSIWKPAPDSNQKNKFKKRFYTSQVKEAGGGKNWSVPLASVIILFVMGLSLLVASYWLCHFVLTRLAPCKPI